jgi:predicted nucleic acid-binding protein
MNYFDTSFLVPLFVDESTSSRVEQFLKRQDAGQIAVSQWTCVEFSGVIARRIRIGSMSGDSAARIESAFDTLTAESFVVIAPTPTDFELATRYLRRYETGLRSGDALHLAIASNHSAQAIYSLDEGLVRAGRMLDLPTKTGIRLP